MLVATNFNQSANQSQFELILAQLSHSLSFPFFSPSRPFLIEGVLGSKNLFSESCLKWPITLGWTPFQTPSAILGATGGHFGFCRRCDVAGGERVPPAPLGWYFCRFCQVLLNLDLISLVLTKVRPHCAF